MMKKVVIYIFFESHPMIRRQITNTLNDAISILFIKKFDG